MNISNSKELKEALRSGAYAWPGGYPTYFITSDGAALSHASVRANFRHVLASVRGGLRDGWKVEAMDVNWEDPELYCDHSGERIESAYAEDAATLARVGTSLPSDGADD